MSKQRYAEEFKPEAVKQKSPSAVSRRLKCLPGWA